MWKWSKLSFRYVLWWTALSGFDVLVRSSRVKLTSGTLRDSCSSLQSLAVDGNICDSNVPFEQYARNLCENFTERDYWGALLDKHLRRRQLLPRSDVIIPSFKGTSSYGLSFVFFFFFCFFLCHHRWYEKDTRCENSDFAIATVWSYLHPWVIIIVIRMDWIYEFSILFSRWFLKWILIWFSWKLSCHHLQAVKSNNTQSCARQK